MKFTADSSREGSAPRMAGRLVYENMPEILVGNICQAIEMLGLKDTQERATKDTIKNLIYENFSYDRGCRYLDHELVSVIDSVHWQSRRYAEKEGILVGNADYCLTMTLPIQEVTDTEEVK